MPLLPKIEVEASPMLKRIFLPYQINWILNDAPQLLAEKSVRIGWTFADAYKNVRKRLEHAKRDYLFATKDYATALEYIRQCQQFCEMFNFARFIRSRGEKDLRVPVFDGEHMTQFTQELRAGVITFQNGSRIMAFSSSPNALRAYGGDVGLDEFAFHQSASELWAAASGRVTWGYDLAIWSSHNGSDSLFHQFVREATSQTKAPWSYYRVTLPDAIDMGLVEKINHTRKTTKTREQFFAECRARARFEEVFEQEYLCNPGGGGDTILPWETLELSLVDEPIERCHAEEGQVPELVGEFHPLTAAEREKRIEKWLMSAFEGTFNDRQGNYRLGFDVAASGRGNLSAFYIANFDGRAFPMKALLTCRTRDWHFLKTVLNTFIYRLSFVLACGDETGLGRQICWEAAQHWGCAFQPVNFSRDKHDLGFELASSIATGKMRFPRAHPDIAADIFALRKRFNGTRWVFSESENPVNPTSHCDIAWAAALAMRAQSRYVEARAFTFYDD